MRISRQKALGLRQAADKAMSFALFTAVSMAIGIQGCFGQTALNFNTPNVHNNLEAELLLPEVLNSNLVTIFSDVASDVDLVNQSSQVADFISGNGGSHDASAFEDSLNSLTAHLPILNEAAVHLAASHEIDHTGNGPMTGSVNPVIMSTPAPVSRAIDMHVCPMVSPVPTPHVGGPISMESPIAVSSTMNSDSPNIPLSVLTALRAANVNNMSATSDLNLGDLLYLQLLMSKYSSFTNLTTQLLATFNDMCLTITRNVSPASASSNSYFVTPPSYIATTGFTNPPAIDMLANHNPTSNNLISTILNQAGQGYQSNNNLVDDMSLRAEMNENRTRLPEQVIDPALDSLDHALTRRQDILSVFSPSNTYIPKAKLPLAAKISPFKLDAVIRSDAEAADHALSDQQASGILHLKKGDFIFAPNKCMVLHTSMGKVRLQSGCIVLVSEQGNRLIVANLYDNSHTDVVVHADDREHNLTPGQALTLISKQENQGRTPNIASALEHTNIRNIWTTNNSRAFISEFSLLSAAVMLKHIDNFPAEDKAMSKRLMKMAAIQACLKSHKRQ